ncbi:MAG TPA: hypothetical protein VE732_03815 [Nitrososphaera sp.]|jgi:hypothetical protein|nr:hypothetical protein [Nitrososphaera sp.]
MKSCPTCKRTFEDTFTFCLVDGSILSAPFDPQATLLISNASNVNQLQTEILPSKQQPAILGNEKRTSALKTKKIVESAPIGTKEIARSTLFGILVVVIIGVIYAIMTADSGGLVIGTVLGIIFGPILGIGFAVLIRALRALMKYAQRN